MLRDLVPIRINKHTFHVNNAIYEFYADEKTVRLRIRLPFYRWRHELDGRVPTPLPSHAVEAARFTGEPDCDYPLDLPPAHLDMLTDRFWRDLSGGLSRIDLVALIDGCKASVPHE